MSRQSNSTDDRLERLAVELIQRAVSAAMLTNIQAAEGNLLTSRVNFGSMIQALWTLSRIGHRAYSRERNHGRVLTVTNITVDGKVVFHEGDEDKPQDRGFWDTLTTKPKETTE